MQKNAKHAQNNRSDYPDNKVAIQPNAFADSKLGYTRNPLLRMNLTHVKFPAVSIIYSINHSRKASKLPRDKRTHPDIFAISEGRSAVCQACIKRNLQ
jgi:hypothetical protein